MTVRYGSRLETSRTPAPGTCNIELKKTRQLKHNITVSGGDAQLLESSKKECVIIHVFSLFVSLHQFLTEFTTATGTQSLAKRDMPPLKPTLFLATMARSMVVVRFNMTTSKDVRANSNAATATGKRDINVWDTRASREPSRTRHVGEIAIGCRVGHRHHHDPVIRTVPGTRILQLIPYNNYR